MNQIIEGMPAGVTSLFAGVWLLAVVYIAALGGLVARMNWLRRRGRAPGMTEAVSFGNTFAMLKLLFTSLPAGIADPLATGLLWAVRVMLVIYVPLFGYLVWSMPRG